MEVREFFTLPRWDRLWAEKLETGPRGRNGPMKLLPRLSPCFFVCAAIQPIFPCPCRNSSPFFVCGAVWLLPFLFFSTMSDLQKLFIRRIKQHERAVGLDLLAEDPSDSPLEPPVAPVPISSTSNNVLNQYEAAKQDTFPIIDQIHDDSTDMTFQCYYKPPGSAKAPIFVCHHGAGSSSMTFCVLTNTLQEVAETSNEAPGVFAFDMRGHGGSSMSNPVDYDLNTLTEDFGIVIRAFIAKHLPPNSLYLVGHSLGGSVLTNYLVKYPDTNYNFRGLTMIDIVEETAVKSFNSMPQFLRNRPQSFISYQSAIDFHVKQIHLLNNMESARISIPDILVEKLGVISWRTNLEETAPFWDSWFLGLSENFVKCHSKSLVAKLLVLSGHETLDTNLIIGQMQGKYQLIVFNNTADSGHFVQEDIPKHLAISLLDFVRRNDSPDEYMKKEFGFIPKWGGKINT